MFKKIANFNEKNTTIYFFISIIVIIIFLAFNSFSESEKEKTCVLPKDTVNNRENYKYDVKLKKGDEVILFNITRYKDKYLIEKTEKGFVYSYYIYYLDVYEKDTDGTYNKLLYNGFVDGIDNKLLFIDYINDLSLISTQTVTDDKTCYKKDNEKFNICLDSNNVITYNEDNITLTYEISSAGDVENFDISVNEKIKELDNTKSNVNNESIKVIENNS